MTTSTISATGSANGVLGHSVRPLSQLWQVPAFLIGAVALALVAAAAPLAPHVDELPLDNDLLAVRRALEKPGLLGPEIVALAEGAVTHARQHTERAGEASFLLGAVYLRQAERQPDPAKRRAEREQAGHHLEWAELRGVPEADVARLTYLRGKVAFLVAGNLPRAIELLSKSLPGGADDAAEGYAMLVQAHLQTTVPDIDAALAANLRLMEYCNDDITMAQARLLRGELLLKKDLRAEAIQVLDSIGPKAPQDARLKARMLQAKAAMEINMWGQAIGWWSELLPHPEAIPGMGKGRILYNIGLCNAHFDAPHHEKEAISAWRECQLFGGEEAQAAALRLAELRLYGGGDPEKVLAHLKEALEKTASPLEYKNTLINLANVRELLEEACRIFDEHKDSEHFLQAAEMYKRIALAGAADEKVGAAAKAQGMELLKSLQPQKARTFFFQAAKAYERAAENRSPAESVEALWQAVECYRAAEMRGEAVAVLRKFVELPTTADRKAEAWFTLAEIQKAEPLMLADAAASYKHCVAFNSQKFTLKALLRLADIALSVQNLDEAQALLIQIKGQPGPNMDRESHQLALVKLANLYFQRKQFEKAELECKELINQYPAQDYVLKVREQLGECYLKLASQAFDNANGPTDATPAAKKQHYMKLWQDYLGQGRIVFQEITEELDAKADELAMPPAGKMLPPAEERLRRDAHFKVVDCYLELASSPQELSNSLHEAFLRSTRLHQQYRNDREGLWACQRLCQCLTKALQLPNRDNVDIYREAAEAAVEYCLQHVEEYDLAGAFATVEMKQECQLWLTNMRVWLKNAKSRGG